MYYKNYIDSLTYEELKEDLLLLLNSDTKIVETLIQIKKLKNKILKEKLNATNDN